MPVPGGQDRFPRPPAGGVDYLMQPGDTEDVVRFRIDGELYPRLVLDGQTPAILVGNGATPPVALVGGAIGVPTAISYDISAEFVAGENGVLVAGVGDEDWRVKGSMQLVAVTAQVGVAPAGGSVIIDVNKNGTTVFTNQAHRPLIGPGQFLAVAPAIDVPAFTDGDLLSVDIDGVGASGSTGLDLVVQCWFSRATAGVPTTGAAVPNGGTNLQYLRKVGTVDGVTEWANFPVILGGVPAGGTIGQLLAKLSNADGDVGWVNPPSVAPGTGLSVVRFAKDWTLGDVWGAWDEVIVTNDGLTHAKSVVADTSTYLANADGRFGRVAHVSSTGGNDRRILVPNGGPTDTNFEMQTEWRDRRVGWAAGSPPQFGHAMRIQNIGDAVNQVMYMVWIDSTFNQDDILNIGIWRGISPAGTFAQIDPHGLTLEALDSYYQVYESARQSNVAYFNIESDHKIAVGDQVVINVADASFEAGGTVISVTDTQVAVANVAADAAWAPNLGWLRHQKTFPLTVCSRVVGDVFEAKAWRSNQPVPSWSDSDAVLRLVSVNANRPTIAAGAHGLLVGHLTAGENIDFGPTVFRTPSDRP